MVHDTPLDRLQVVVGLGLHARLLHEGEEYVQADLKLAFARFGQPCIVGTEYTEGLVSDIFTNHWPSHFFFTNLFIHGILILFIATGDLD